MPTTLDPHNHSSGDTKQVILCAYDQLMRLDDQTGEIHPVIASSWERLDDTTLRCQIREGPEFENGDPVTPEDVAFSINRIVDPDVGGLASARAENLATIDRVEVVDGERAVDVHLNTADPIITGRLGNTGTVMSKSWIQEHENSYIAQNMMGSGPYKLANYDPSTEVVLERKDEYWGDESDVEDLQMPDPTELRWGAASEASTRVNQLLAGETDIINSVPAQEASRIDNADNANMNPIATDRPMFIAMKYNVEPFSSKKFRKAMNYAVDVQSIVNNVLDGYGSEPMAGVVPDYWFGHNPDLEPYGYDPELAEQLVEESGMAGAEFDILAGTGSYLKAVEVTTAVANMIDELPNVSCGVNQTEYQAWVDQISGPIEDEPESYFLGWGSNPPDTTVKMEIVSCDATDGWSHFCDERIDEMVQEANNTMDQEEREEILMELNALVRDLAPVIFLYRNYGLFASSNRVDFEPSPAEDIRYHAIDRANSN
jgi:peptide/nickel transport system substrate-binding protein